MPTRWYNILLRLLAAALAGALIGYERKRKGKPAGLRTLMLVSAGAASYALAAEQAALRYGEPMEAARIMSAIATGVGFLGAGVIVKSGTQVRWLTTAASLWATASLGYGFGLGMWWVAVPATVLVWVVLYVVDPIEARLFGDDDGETSDND